MLKNIIIISLLLITTAAADQAADKAEFKRLYAEFNELYANSQELDPIIKVAEQVYDLARKAYGKKSQNTAVVTYNLASLYDEKGDKMMRKSFNSKARDLFADYFKIINKNDTPQDRTYIFQYLQYIKAMASDDSAKSLNKHAKKLRKIATTNNYSDAERAELEFKLGLYLFKDNDYIPALAYFKKSNELYTQALGPDHFKVGETSFWIAKIEMARKKRKSAEEYFLSALDVFDQNNQIGSGLSQSSHAFLVTLYEDMDQTDMATKHCQAVAEERPKGFDQFISPLYRKAPEFPKLSSVGYKKTEKNAVDVLLQFDIDKDGFTRNVKIVTSDNIKFNKNSLSAAEKYRYAPSVKDGKLVETKNVRVNIRYTMR